MKSLLNLFPIISFFIFFKKFDIFIASAALIITSIIIFILIGVYLNSIQKSDIINLILTIVFGSLTIFSHNSNYIKWKITIIYSLLSIILLFNYLFMKKTFLKSIFEKKINLSSYIWEKLTLIWFIFFLTCAFINMYITLYLSESFWVNFKIFGLTIIFLIFILISGIYIHYCQSKNKKRI